MKHRLSDIVFAALVDEIKRARGVSLGIRSRTLPTEGPELVETLDAVTRVLLENEDVEVFLGTFEAATSAHPRLHVLLPEQAAARATKARNDPSRGDSLVVYLSTIPAAGEAGLSQLDELTGHELVESFVRVRDDLDVVSRCHRSNLRALSNRVRGCTPATLSMFIREFDEKGAAMTSTDAEVFALPLLGLLPTRFGESVRVDGGWASELDGLTGAKKANAIRASLARLSAQLSEGEVDAVGEWLAKEGAVPRGLTHAQAVEFARLRGDALGRYARGEESEFSPLAGCTKSLLGLLVKPEQLSGVISKGADADDAAEDASEEGGDDELAGSASKDATVSEESLLYSGGPDALRVESLLWEKERWGRTLLLTPQGGGQTRRVTPSDPGALVELLASNTTSEQRRQVGWVAIKGGEDIVLSGRGGAQRSNDVTYSALPSAQAGTNIGALLSAFYSARAKLLADATMLITGFDTEDGALADAVEAALEDGLTLLARYPLLCAVNLEGAIQAYVESYRGLVAGCEDPQTREELIQLDGGSGWRSLSLLDTAVAFDNGGKVSAARLLALHPVRLEHALAWVAVGEDPGPLPSQVVVKSAAATYELGPQGARYVYWARADMLPTGDGAARALSLGVEAAWALLSLAAFPGAVSVAISDVPEVEALVEALCVRMKSLWDAERRAGDALALELSVDGEALRRLDRAALSEEVQSALATRSGGGFSLRIRERSPDDLVHLLVEGHRTSTYAAQARDVSISTHAVHYVPSLTSGHICRVDLMGTHVNSAYRSLLKNIGVVNDLNHDPIVAPTSDTSLALVHVRVARGGWPVQRRDADAVLAYDQSSEDVIVASVDRGILDRALPRSLAAAAGDAISLRHLRRAAFALYDLRMLPLDLLRRPSNDARLRADLSKAVAFSSALHASDERGLLVLSLDSPEGHLWARHSSSVFNDKRRADLLILEATLDEAGRPASVDRMRVVELKARPSRDAVSTPTKRAAQAMQARLVAARIRHTAETPSTRLREGLRALWWLGAGLQQSANRWEAALRELDAALAGGALPPVLPELWCLASDSGGGGVERGVDRAPRVDPFGAPEVDGEGEALKWVVASLPSSIEQWTEDSVAGAAPATREIGERALSGELGAGSRAGAAAVAAALDVLSSSAPLASAVEGVERATPQTEQLARTPVVPVGGGTPPGAAPDASTFGLHVVARPVVRLGLDPRQQVISWDPFKPGAALNNGHVVVLGASGAGKTQVMKVFLDELCAQRVSALILDFKDDYVGVDFRAALGANLLEADAGLPINPLALVADPVSGRVNVRNKVYELSGILRKVYGLGDQQEANLRAAIFATYAAAGIARDATSVDGLVVPAFADVGAHLTATGDAALVNRLSPMFDLSLFRGESDAFVDVLARPTVIRLAQLPTEQVKRAVAEIVLMSLYNTLVRLGHCHGVRLCVLVDEAHKIAKLDAMAILMKEARAYGVAVLLSSQEARDFDDAIFSNAGSLLVLKLSETRDSERVATMLGGAGEGKELGARIRALQPFRGFLKNDQLRPYVSVVIEPHHLRRSGPG